MKRMIKKTLLLGAAIAFLITSHSLSVQAMNITAGDASSAVISTDKTLVSVSGDTTSITKTSASVSGSFTDAAKTAGRIADAYMPHIDAFTIASENSIHMPEAGEYTNMIMADVTDFVNIRTEPDTESGIIGRIYDNAAARIIKFSPVDDTWLEIESGEVTGYVKAEFFLFGTAASDAIEAYIQEGNTLTYARSMNDILAEIAAQEKAKEEARRAEEAARKAAEAQKAAAQQTSTGTDSNSTIESTASGSTATTAETAADGTSANSDLRQDIVDFAMQYLGGPYVHGGNSLSNGTDCSGFTSLVFAEFGYSLSRTPSGQLSSSGTKIEYSEILPGDIICYTSNGKTCTHVALYIGDGLIIHAANAKKGIIVNDADYSTIMGVKRIIE